MIFLPTNQLLAIICPGLVKIGRGAGSWLIPSIIKHLPVVKGVNLQTPLLINQPMGKGHLCVALPSGKRLHNELERSTIFSSWENPL